MIGVVFFGFNVTSVIELWGNSQQYKDWKEGLKELRKSIETDYPEALPAYLTLERMLVFYKEREQNLDLQDKKHRLTYQMYLTFDHTYSRLLEEICEKKF